MDGDMDNDALFTDNIRAICVYSNAQQLLLLVTRYYG